jgi:hypothetical protein
MDYSIDAAPVECLNKATTYMMSKGYSIDHRSKTWYSIDNRSEHSATLSRIPKWEFGPTMTCAILVGTLFNLGLLLAFFGLLIVLGVVMKWKATLVAVSTPDGRTRLTTGGSHHQVRETLASMVREEFGDRAEPL